MKSDKSMGVKMAPRGIPNYSCDRVWVLKWYPEEYQVVVVTEWVLKWYPEEYQVVVVIEWVLKWYPEEYQVVVVIEYGCYNGTPRNTRLWL